MHFNLGKLRARSLRVCGAFLEGYIKCIHIFEKEEK
jgi:hypothetical protein